MPSLCSSFGLSPSLPGPTVLSSSLGSSFYFAIKFSPQNPHLVSKFQDPRIRDAAIPDIQDKTSHCTFANCNSIEGRLTQRVKKKWGRDRDGETQNIRENQKEALGRGLSQRIGRTRPPLPSIVVPLLPRRTQGIQAGRTEGQP